MVLKTGRGDIVSGNTLRLTKSGYLKQYGKDAYISYKCNSNTSDNDEAQFLDSKCLQYSLNKKKRWCLPGIIKDEIQTDLLGSDLKVTLLESHNIGRDNNCVGFYSNKGRFKEVLPKNKTYLNRKSIKNINDKPTRTKTKNRKYERQCKGDNYDINIDENADDKPEGYFYEVVYPASTKSSNIFSKPTISKSKNNACSWVPLSNVTSKKTRTRKVNINADDFKDDEEIDDEDTLVDEDNTVYEKRTNVCGLNEYFTHAFTNNQDCRQFKRQKRTKKSVTHKIPAAKKDAYLKQLQEEEFQNLDEEHEEPFKFLPTSLTLDVRSTTDIIPVKVVLTKSEVSETSLKQKFPGKVFFAKCHPRKFSIDITDDVKNTLKRSSNFKQVLIQKLNLTSFVVFSFVKDYDDCREVIKVHLNCCANKSFTKIETIFDLMITTLDDVIQRCLMFCEGVMIPEAWEKNDHLDIKPLHQISFDTLSPAVVQSSILVQSNILSVDSEETQNYEQYVWIPRNKSEFCSICFEKLIETPSTALMLCDHWFCNQCWKDHILSLTAGSKICPEYSCKTVVDLATIITLINIKDLIKIQVRNKTLAVGKSLVQKWCPSNVCGRILEASIKCPKLIPGAVVICSCGVNICFSCEREGHWPANCRQFFNYYTKLDKFTDDCLKKPYWGTADVIVCGKPCPGCNMFIVKNGGCPSMRCSCGMSFCWSCLTPWSTHSDNTRACYAMRDREGTKKQIIRNTIREDLMSNGKSKYYLRALDNRKERHHKHITAMQQKANELRLQIRSWVMRTSSRTGSSLTLRSVDDLFRDLVDTKIQLNYVAEFCNVIIDSGNDSAGSWCRNIQDTASRLHYLGKEIYELLVADSPVNYMRTFSRLVTLKDNAILLLKSIVRQNVKFYSKSNL